MKCMNCGVEISKEFKFAIGSNKCPACSKQIMNAGNMTAFVPLCETIETFLTSADALAISTAVFGQSAEPMGKDFAAQIAEKLVEKIITSFNVHLPGSKTVKTSDTIEVEEDGPQVAVDKDGVRYETFDKKNQEKLQKLRDEALRGAQEDLYGITFDEDIKISDDPKANAALIKQRQKQSEASQVIANGGAGKNSFGRSG